MDEAIRSDAPVLMSSLKTQEAEACLAQNVLGLPYSNKSSNRATANILPHSRRSHGHSSLCSMAQGTGKVDTFAVSVYGDSVLEIYGPRYNSVIVRFWSWRLRMHAGTSTTVSAGARAGSERGEGVGALKGHVEKQHREAQTGARGVGDELHNMRTWGMPTLPVRNAKWNASESNFRSSVQHSRLHPLLGNTQGLYTIGTMISKQPSAVAQFVTQYPPSDTRYRIVFDQEVHCATPSKDAPLESELEVAERPVGLMLETLIDMIDRTRDLDDDFE